MARPHWDNRRSLAESLTFEEAVDVALSDDYQPGQRGYFSRGYYLKYVNKYLQFFNPDQMLILVFEDLKSRPLALFKDLFEFIGVSTLFHTPDMEQRFNAPKIPNNPIYKFFFHQPRYCRYIPTQLRRLLFLGERRPYQYPPMNPEIRNMLVSFYREANRKLGDYIGRNLEFWNA